MFKRKQKDNFDSMEEDVMNLASKEEEIINSYDEEIEYEEKDEINEIEDSTIGTEEYNEEYDYEEFSEIEENNSNKKYNINKIINISFIVVFIILCMITIDVISVARYENGPFFAIPLKKYNDGGSKEYYGFGYKVIKYHQKQGRRDKEIGLWNLKYNIEPITLEDLDLAIEINGKETKTYKKYYKKFVRIVSTLEKIDTKNNKITISYQDEDQKYSLDMICSMKTSQKDLKKLTEKEKITVIGTIKDLKHKTKNTPTTLYLENCFAEQ